MLLRMVRSRVHGGIKKMTGRVSQVRTAVTLRLVVPRADVLLDAVLRYDRDDPYAVQLSFPTSPGRDAIEWIFARSLVAEGLSMPAGDGDVRIWPSPATGTPPTTVVATAGAPRWATRSASWPAASTSRSPGPFTASRPSSGRR